MYDDKSENCKALLIVKMAERTGNRLFTLGMGKKGDEGMRYWGAKRNIRAALQL